MVSFHSGYDFGYLLKVVTCSPLPAQEADFFALLRVWFPCIYDIKFLMRSCKTLKGGLQDVADDLQVSRIGQQHQAGSDSLLTATTFFKMRQKYFDGQIDDSKYLGCLYGFSSSSSHANGMVHYNQDDRDRCRASTTLLRSHAPCRVATQRLEATDPISAARSSRAVRFDRALMAVCHALFFRLVSLSCTTRCGRRCRAIRINSSLSSASKRLS